MTRFEKMLRWDSHRLTVDKLQWYTRHIENQGGGDILWGYIDGTLQRICRPSKNQQIYYSGHKHHHGYKIQGILTPDGLFSSAWGPIVGSCGDWYVFQQSDIEQDIKRLYENAGIPEDEQLYVYGDPAYTGSSATMGAYRRPRGGELTPAQADFNKQMSKKRVSVEHGYGFVQKYWTKSAFHLTN